MIIDCRTRANIQVRGVATTSKDRRGRRNVPSGLCLVETPTRGKAFEEGMASLPVAHQPRRIRTAVRALDVSNAAFGNTVADRCLKSGTRASVGCAAGERGNQVYLVGITENLLRVRLTPVDHEEDGVVAAGQREAVEQVCQRASGWKPDVEPAQPAVRRAPLQCRVQMNPDGDVYQLKMLSRSASAAS